VSEEVFVSPQKHGRIMVMISGRGSNFKAIHDAIQAGRINAEIALVFSNREEAPGLGIARERGLETLALNSKLYPDKEEYDRAIVRAARERGVDLICLAGYMKILTPMLCGEFKNRIMNIHPGPSPLFPRTPRPAEGDRLGRAVLRGHGPLRVGRSRHGADHHPGLRPRLSG
jgi:phosphoribosylglycinamide formyltransferase-1